jgi:hypothetical protein
MSLAGSLDQRAEGLRDRVLAALRARFTGNALRLAMVLAAGYVYMLRQPLFVTAPSFWAEDGNVYFKEAIEHGLGAVFGAYNGQLFLFQRLVALLAAPLPVLIQPAIYAYVAMATAVLCCSIALSSRWRYPVPLAARFVCVLALLCSPAVHEVFGTLTNAHWWLALGLVLLGMLSDPLGRRSRLGELAFTAVAAFTGVAAFFALPALAVRCLRNRSRHSLALAGIALAGALTQVGYFLMSTRHLNGAGMGHHPLTAVLVLLRRVPGSAVFGDANLTVLWPERMPETWVWLFVIALGAALTVVWARTSRLEVASLLLALVGGWLLALAGAPSQSEALLYGGRYFVVPVAMLYVSLVVAWPADMLRRTMTGLACVLLASGILSDYHLYALPATDWASFAQCMDHSTARTCITSIAPNWTLIVNPPGR